MDGYPFTPSTGLVRDMEPEVRPAARMLRLGPAGLKDEELLALTLGLSSLDQARDILARRSLAQLLMLPMAQLSSVRFIRQARATRLMAALELARRGLPQSGAVQELPTMNQVSDVAAHALEIRDKKKEYLLAFFLNARHQLIKKEIISIGTLTASLAHPREIFAPAIGEAAAGIILCHNHPSGDPSPSDEDARLTTRIAQAGRIMGIELLDHLIIAAGGCYSFKTAGRLS